MEVILGEMMESVSAFHSVFQLKAFMEVSEQHMKARLAELEDSNNQLKIAATTAQAEKERAEERERAAVQRERERHEWLHSEYVKRASA